MYIDYIYSYIIIVLILYYIYYIICIIFENTGVQFINMARILKNPEIIKPLPTSSVKFPMPIVT